MFTLQSIDNVKQAASIEVVVQDYVPLKKQGVNYSACCPFHDEKSPSFTVSPSKGIYKCFGCGEGGDSISFVMNYKNVDFMEAIRILADRFSIQLEEDHSNKEEAQAFKKVKADLALVVRAAAKNYRIALFAPFLSEAVTGVENNNGSLPTALNPAMHELTVTRQLTRETLDTFMVGFAPDGWRFITDKVVNIGLLQLAMDAGLVKHKNERNYDAFRNRIMFPIRDVRGIIIGFGGRLLPEGQETRDKGQGTDQEAVILEGSAEGELQSATASSRPTGVIQTPHSEIKIAKYLNSPDSALYQKNKVLYGLYEAQDSIRKSGRAYIVEGYIDVMAFHQAGLPNTVAPCGTALTKDQLLLLKKYTGHLILVGDGDKAGQDSMMKGIDLALSLGFKVEVIQLPANEDPDTFARAFYEQTTVNSQQSTELLPNEAVILEGSAEGELQSAIGTPHSEINKAPFKILLSDMTLDGLIWKSGRLMLDAGTDPFKRSNAERKIAHILSLIYDISIRDYYLKELSKKGNAHNINRQILSEFLKAELEAHSEKEKEAEKENDFISSIKHEEADTTFAANHGWYPLIKGKETGVWMETSKGYFVHVCNFVLTPLYHNLNPKNNMRMCEVNNGTLTKVIKFPDAAMISNEKFSSIAWNAGKFLWKGNGQQLIRLAEYWGDKFDECEELTTLGMQPEGFFAFSNIVYNGKDLVEYDKYGIFPFKNTKYLSMPASQLNTQSRSGNNEYVNDQYLTYKPSPIDFRTWAEYMEKVYGQHGWMLIAYAVMSAFKDLVTQVTKMPLLYLYGEVASGKSEAMESIQNLYFSGLDMEGNLMKPFNLNHGTTYAFYSLLGRFFNCPVGLNEFDDSIDEERYKSIKAAYDGEGRQKGDGTANGKTTTQAINCTIVIVGQYLSTIDGGSIVTRSILMPFQKPEERPEQQKLDFVKLKDWERQGISGILIEILAQRDKVKHGYKDKFASIQKRMSDEFSAEGARFDLRMMKNILAPLTMVTLLGEQTTEFNPPLKGATGDDERSFESSDSEELQSAILRFPFTSEEFYQHCKNMVLTNSNRINSSNALSGFWKMVEFLLDRGQIFEGSDFKIETHDSVSLRGEKGEEYVREFSPAKKLLFIRINNIQKLYAQFGRQQGDKGLLNEQSLIHYIKGQKYYIGSNKASRFMGLNGKSAPTSSMVLDYDMMKINLERFDDTARFDTTGSSEPAPVAKQDDIPF